MGPVTIHMRRELSGTFVPTFGGAALPGKSKYDREFVGYAVAILAVALAAVAGKALEVTVGEMPAFITFYPTVMLVAVFYGTGPGMVATVLATMAAGILFLDPVGVLKINAAAGAVALSVFLGINAGVSLLAGRLRAARQRASDEARRAEAQARRLRESEATLRAVLDALPVGVVIAGSNGKILHVNAANNELWGVPPETTSWEQYGEWVGYWPETGRRIQAHEWAMARALHSGEIVTNELVECERFDTKQRRFYLNNAAPVRDPAGNIIAGVVAELDVTDRLAAERALRESEQRLRLALETSNTGAWDLDLVDHTAFRSPEHDRIFGYPEPLNEWTYEIFLNHVLPEDRERVDAAFHHATDTQGDWTFECRIRRADGEIRWIRAAGGHRTDETGRVRGMAGIVQDITERKSMEQDLASTRERLETALAAGDVATWVWDINGDRIFADRNLRAFFGVSPAEGHGGSLSAYLRSIHPDDRDEAAKVIETALGTTQSTYRAEYRVTGADGKMRWVLARGRIERDGQGRAVRMPGVILDVTQRKQAEEQVRRSRSLLSEAEKLSHTGAWEWDLTSDRWSFSDEWLAIHGCPKQMLTQEELLSVAHPDDREAIDRAMENVRTGTAPYEMEHRIVRLDDGQVRTVRARGQYVQDTAGEVVRVYGFAQDVTERKQAEEELRRWKDQLEAHVQERTAELAAANRELEAFGYTVSHDLRAPLRHITGFVEVLSEHAGPSLDEQARRYLDIISKAGQRMGQLIDDLLTLSRIGRAALTHNDIDLRQVVDEVIEELAPEMDGRTIDWHIGPLPQVRGDRTLLRAAVVNLISNAIKYTRGRDCAMIEVGCRQQDGEAVCHVKDNGAGFDMKYADKLFGVFQRLHPASEFEGTGIGLASVRRIIQRHGGRTWAEGAVGQGATFYFALPQKEANE